MIDFDMPLMMLAQDTGLPPVPGEGDAVPNSGTTTAGGPAAPNTQSPPPSLLANPMLMMIVIVLVLLITMTMSSRRDKKRREAMLSGIKKHDRVQTVGGVIGSVVEVKPDTVVLKVDESSNTRITFSRAAIQQILSSSPETTT